MNTLLAISLVPAAIKQIKVISKEVIPLYPRVRVTSEEVILQKRLFSRKQRIPLVTFLTETLPKEITKWAKSKDIEPPLPYFGNSAEFLLHLNSIGEDNIISYLWNRYNYATTMANIEAEPDILESMKYVVNTRIITNVATDKVIKDLKRMVSSIEDITRTFRTEVSPISVVHRSPDIRGSPKLCTIDIEQRQIS